MPSNRDVIDILREVRRHIPDELIQRYLCAAINRLERIRDNGTIVPRSTKKKKRLTTTRPVT